jgi:hypothetical protein
VDSDLRSARLILEIIQEQQRLPVIVKAQTEAASILLMVLYTLQQEHVQFLIRDYKARVIDAHGHDAFTTKVRAKKLGKDGLPREVHDVNVPPPSSGQIVDMSQNDELKKTQWIPTMKVRESISTGMVKETRLTPMSPPPHNRKGITFRRKRRCLLKTPKRLASALTPRHAMRRATTTS